MSEIHNLHLNENGELILKKGNCLDPYFYQVGAGVTLARRTPVGRLA